MKVNTSKKINYYTQGQQFAARVLLIVWLLASGSPEGVLASPQGQPAIKPSPQGFFRLLVTSCLLCRSGSPKDAPQCQASKVLGDPNLASPPECPVIPYPCILSEVSLGLETLTKEGQQLMEYAAYLDPGFIPLALVSVVLEEDDSDQLSEVVSDLSGLSLVQMVSNTERQAGLQVTTKGQKHLQGWHPKVALCTETILLTLAKKLQAQMPWVEPTPDEGWQQARLYAPHVEKVVTALEESKVAPSAVVAKLLGYMGQYSKEVQVDNRGAVKFFQRSLTIFEQVYQETPNHPDIALTLNNLGIAWLALGDVRQAVSFYQRALALYEQVYQATPNHPDIALTLNNLGIAWYALGDMCKAISYHDRALALYEQVYQETPHHPDIARTLNNLGHAWSDLKNTCKVKNYYYERVLAIWEILWSKLENRLKLENTRKGMGYYERALKIYKQVYQATSNHPEIARTLGNLGHAYYALGDARQAVSFYERSLAIYEQVYQATPNHSEIAKTLNNLGNAWRALGDVRQAVSFYQCALAMKEQMYQATPHHPEIAKTLNNLGVALQNVDDASQAISSYRRTLEIYKQVYQATPHHPEIARTFNNLGTAWYALGEGLKAVSSYQRVLAIKEQMYQATPHHPEIAKTLNNLGVTLQNVDDASQDVGFYEQFLAIFKQIYDKISSKIHAFQKRLY